PRLQEMFKLVGQELDKHGLLPLVPAGAVLTGGGAETVGMIDVCKRTLGLPTRVGRPQGLKGLTDEVLVSPYATSAGLLVYGAQLYAMHSAGSRDSHVLDIFKHLPIKPLADRLVKFVKSVMP
ncbi:MAG: cell division protein FtsA, partial [Patescibacteria group bacterium]